MIGGPSVPRKIVKWGAIGLVVNIALFVGAVAVVAYAAKWVIS